jgi:hypothetical protein
MWIFRSHYRPEISMGMAQLMPLLLRQRPTGIIINHLHDGEFIISVKASPDQEMREWVRAICCNFVICGRVSARIEEG